MTHAYWNDWYFGWGWFSRKPALDILDERYARGDIGREEYVRLKTEISAP